MNWNDRIMSACDTIEAKSERPLVGSSEAEIVTVEELLHVRFPLAYRTYLLRAGADPGMLEIGSDIRLSDLHDNAESLSENVGGGPANLGLPEPRVVFFGHHSLLHFFIQCGLGPDPEVFGYQEYHPATKPVAESFSKWLEDAAERTLPHHKYNVLRLDC